MLDRNELEQMLDGMVRTGGTTLHLSASEKPSVRIQGKLVRSQNGPASSEALWDLIEQIVPKTQFDQLAAGEEVQSLFTSESGVCFRNALMLDEAGPNPLLRPLQGLLFATIWNLFWFEQNQNNFYDFEKQNVFQNGSTF